MCLVKPECLPVEYRAEAYRKIRRPALNLDTTVNNSYVRNVLLEIGVPARRGAAIRARARRHSRGRLDPRHALRDKRRKKGEEKDRYNSPLCVCLLAGRFGDGDAGALRTSLVL